MSIFMCSMDMKKDLADLVHLSSSKYPCVADPKAIIPGDSSKKTAAKPCSVAWSTAPLPRLLPFLSWPFKFPQYPSTAWVPAVHRKLEEAGLFRSCSWKASKNFSEAASLGSRDDLVNCFGSPGLLECRIVAEGTAGGRAPTRFAFLNPQLHLCRQWIRPRNVPSLCPLLRSSQGLGGPLC